jgi:hypothetical protein
MAPSPLRSVRESRPGGAYSHSFSASLRGRGERQISGTISKRPAPRAPSKRDALVDASTQALAARRYGDALNHIMGLVTLEPSEARWHQKYGEVLHTLGRNREAAAAYRRAARRYEVQALPARANAALRVAETLEGRAPTLSQRILSDRQATRPILRAVERPTSRPPKA